MIHKTKIRSLLFSRYQILTTRTFHCCSTACEQNLIKCGVPRERLCPVTNPLYVDWHIHRWLIKNRQDAIYQLPALQHLFKKKKLKAQLIDPRVLNHPSDRPKPKTRLCYEFMSEKQLYAWCGHTRQQIETLASCGPQRISPMAIVIFLTQLYRAVGFYCIEALYGYTRQTATAVFHEVKDWLMKYEVPKQLISDNYEMNKRVWTRERIKNATPNYYYALHSKPTPTKPPPAPPMADPSSLPASPAPAAIPQNPIPSSAVPPTAPNSPSALPALIPPNLSSGSAHPSSPPMPSAPPASSASLPASTAAVNPESAASTAPNIPQARATQPSAPTEQPKKLSKEYLEWKRKCYVADVELEAREANRADALSKRAAENKEDDEKAVTMISPVSATIGASKEECGSDCECPNCHSIAPSNRNRNQTQSNSEKFSHIIIASDGTYGYVERVNSHRVSKKAWSEQKKRVLYKPHITISVDGKAIMCQTFFANGHNTDQSISNAQFSAAYVRWCSKNQSHRDCIFTQEQIDELIYFQQFIYLPGDVHLVDGGYYFALDERFRAPPRVHQSDDDPQFSVEQTNEKALVTLYRGVIERYFALVKRFKMLGDVLNWHHVRDYDQLWKIGCALTNEFGPALTSDSERNDNIVQRIENCAVIERNILEDTIEEYNIKKKTEKQPGWYILGKTREQVLLFLQHMPWLKRLAVTMDDWDFYCGQRYIPKIARPYLQSLAHNFEVRVCRDNPYLLRFSHLRSKFRSGVEHTVYLNFAHCIPGVNLRAPWNRFQAGQKLELWGDSALSRVQHYCATCVNGRRMIFPDVHCAALLLLIVSLRNNRLAEVLENNIVEGSIPLRVIDAEASKRWLEANGISKKDVIANQLRLNSLRKQNKLAPRKKKAWCCSTSKTTSQSQRSNSNRNPVQSNAQSNVGRNARSNRNSNSNSNNQLLPESESNSGARPSVAVDQNIDTVQCDECGNRYALLEGEEHEEDEFLLCPSCFPFP